MCKLINKETNCPHQVGDLITDQAGRTIWEYSHCATINSQPMVTVRRVTNGKPSARLLTFALEFFPGYRVSVAK